MQDKGLCHGDVMIDDYEKNLIAFRGRGILFDTPYNRHHDAHPRMQNWNQIVRELTKTEIAA